MCQKLDGLRQSIAGYAGKFDPRLLTPAQAGEVVRLCAKIEASVASIKALAAARSAEGNNWKRDGHRTPADELAHSTGMSPAAARRMLETGRRMARQSEVAQAALAGELSTEQAAAVADGAAANPAKAKELIAKAKQGSIRELNEEVAKVKAGACDLEERRKVIHANRSLRGWTNREGAFESHLYGHPEDGARLGRVLDPIRRRLIMLRRGSTKTERLDALEYDALMAIATIADGHHGELGINDLLDLGLFPQLKVTLLTGGVTCQGTHGENPATPSTAEPCSDTQEAPESGDAGPGPRPAKRCRVIQPPRCHPLVANPRSSRFAKARREVACLRSGRPRRRNHGPTAPPAHQRTTAEPRNWRAAQLGS
jgi:hypothetical protein